MDRSPYRTTPVALAGALLLAACGFGEPDEPGPTELDPAVAQALNAPLMSDPDLASLNEANAALTGSSDHSIPLQVANAEAIRDAQDRAIVLAGGRSALVELPEGEEIADAPGDSPLVLLEDVASRVSDNQACLSGWRYSAAWAAKLPASQPVFPRGAVTEAFGQDSRTCTLRAVRFVTPVPAGDIVQFYATLATREKAAFTYSVTEQLWRLEGGKPGMAFVVEVRPSLLGGQEVDLVTASGSAVSPR